MKKILATGLAITLLFGGATFSSASISQSEVEEETIQIVSNGDPVDAQWAAMARKSWRGYRKICRQTNYQRSIRGQQRNGHNS